MQHAFSSLSGCQPVKSQVVVDPDPIFALAILDESSADAGSCGSAGARLLTVHMGDIRI